MAASSARPRSAERRPLADVAQELLDGADGDGRGRRLGLGRGRDAEGDADERQLAVARARGRSEHLGQDGREGRPVGDLAARADGVAQRVDEPDAGAARLADAGQVRGHEHLRARLEVRAVGDGRGAARCRPCG